MCVWWGRHVFPIWPKISSPNFFHKISRSFQQAMKKNYRHSTIFTYCQPQSKMAVFACFLFFLMISKFKSIGLPMNSILMESIIDKNKILLFINVKSTLWTFLWLKVTDFSKITKKTQPHQLHYSVFPSCPVFRSSLGNHR